MAVGRQFLWSGQQRVDVPHLRSLDSSTAYDFDTIAGQIMAGNTAYVVSGFEVGAYTVGQAATALQLITADSAIIHPQASESGSILLVPSTRAPEVLNSANTRVQGSFTPNTTNYIGIDYRRSADTTTEDVVQFLDPNTNLETPKTVPLARTLDYIIIISATDFSSSPSIAPIANVVTDSLNNVSSVTDARNLMFRLGSGGTIPDAFHAYPWAGGRSEAGDNSDFNAGDKQLTDLKDWASACMTRLWELGGGEHWYNPTADRNVVMTQSGSTFTDGEWFEWDGTNLHWQGLVFVFDNSTGHSNAVANQTTDSAGLTDLADGDCVYVDLDRTQNRSGGTALTPVKAALTTLGTPTVPGSRYVIAWRVGSNVYTRNNSFPVGATFFVATTTALGIVKLHQASLSPSSPVVLSDGDLNTATGVVGLDADKTATIAPSASNVTGLTVTGQTLAFGSSSGLPAIVSTGLSYTTGTGATGGDGISATGGSVAAGSGFGGVGVYALGGNGVGGTGAGGSGVQATGAFDNGGVAAGLGVIAQGGGSTLTTNTGGAGVQGTGGSNTSGGGGGPGGPGVVGIGGTSSNGVGGSGVVGTGSGAGAGVKGTGGSSSGVGVAGTGGATNGIGVSGTGTGTGAGGSFTGGGSATAGVTGIAGGTSGAGVVGRGSGAFGSLTMKAQGAYTSGWSTDWLGLPMSRIISWSNDWNGATNSQPAGWATNLNGSGSTAGVGYNAAISDQAAVAFNVTKAATTNYAIIYRDQPAATYRATNQFAMEFDVIPNDLTDGDHYFFGGFTDAPSTASTFLDTPSANNYAALYYNHSDSPGVWVCVINNGGTWAAQVTSSTANVTSGITYKARIEVIGSTLTGGSAQINFYINGTLIHSETSRFPTIGTAAIPAFGINSGSSAGGPFGLWSIGAVRFSGGYT